VAGLVKTPGDWQFSNYLEWIGVRSDGLFDSQIREMFFSTPNEYEKFVLSDIPEALEKKISKYYLD